MKTKVIFCVPTREKPHKAFRESLEKSIPLVIGAGYDEGFLCEKGNPYISAARAAMLRVAQTGKADIVVFLDDDLSWNPQDLLTLIQTPGDVVGGTYRAKEPDMDVMNYMGRPLQDANGKITTMREDGCIKCACLPAGFLKVTKEALYHFSRSYPELLYGPPHDYSIDLFNHGAWKGLWWGEDYAFCRRWNECGGDTWMVPNLNINHHSWFDDRVWRGNFHEFMLRQPGGILDPAKVQTVSAV